MEKRQLTADEIQEVLKKLEEYLNDLKARWDNEGIKNKGWLWTATDRLNRSIAFMLNCLDELIQFVENLIPEGKDKKAAVILLLKKLYDYTLEPAFPIWLKPFSKAIKKIIIDVVFSLAIDFIVNKYRNGIWRIDAQV